MPRAFTRLVVLTGLLALTACAEKTNTSGACPSLCSDPTLAVRDTILDAVVVDTSLGDFPTPGSIPPSLDNYVPVATRGDSLDVRLVLRFDTLPRTRSAADTNPITRLRNSALLLFIDTTVSLRPATGATFELYDVDTTATNDTTSAALLPLFRADRRIGGRTFTGAELRDELRIPLDDAFVLARATTGRRLRIGVRAVGTSSVSFRVLRPASQTVNFTPRVFLDPSPDDSVRSRIVFASSETPVGSARAYLSQILVVRGTTPIGGAQALDVGGIPGHRGYLRFDVPRRFFDSVTVVRATLDMVQRPRRTVPAARDSVGIRPRLVTAGRAVADIRSQVTLLNPTLEGERFAPIVMTPADSGLRSFDVGNLLSAWATRPDTLAPAALVLFSEGEGTLEPAVAFWSREAPQASLRPRLRISYAPRRPSVLP